MTEGNVFERHVAFVDTSGYFATANPRDINHQDAVRVVDRLESERWHQITTNFVLAETHALILGRMGRQAAMQTLLLIREDPMTTILRVTPADEQRAWQIIEQYDDKNYSWTDASSFAVMDRLGLRYAFHYDRNFAQYGFLSFPA